MEDKKFDAIIIGAGTAGLSAAIYLCRAEKKILVLDKNSYGGQIITSNQIENYPGIKQVSGFEFAMKLYEQALKFGATILNESVIRISVEEKEVKKNQNKKKEQNIQKVKNEKNKQNEQNKQNKQNEKKVITDNNIYIANNIIIATGTINRKLSINNEKKYLGRGISYCATCDGAFYKGKKVAVYGGGNTAVEDALYLSEYCNMVYLINRGDILKAEKTMVDILKQKRNVILLLNMMINDFVGENKLEGLVLVHCNNKEKKKIKLEGLFVAIGRIPQNEIFINIINMDKDGYIITNENCETNIDGIYAAGDCRAKRVKQLVTAANDGVIAALSIQAKEWK